MFSKCILSWCGTPYDCCLLRIKARDGPYAQLQENDLLEVVEDIYDIDKPSHMTGAFKNAEEVWHRSEHAVRR